MTERPIFAACSASGLIACVLSGCAPAPKPIPAPVAIAAPATPRAPAGPIDWRDLPLSPGRWAYLPSVAAPVAQFGRPGVAPDFTIGCDRKTHRVTLFRAGRGEGPMTVTTSFSGLSYAVQTGADGVSVTLPATSDFLDRIAFSRGRFTIAVTGQPMLVLPAWAEPGRVIEDCRG